MKLILLSVKVLITLPHILLYCLQGGKKKKKKKDEDLIIYTTIMERQMYKDFIHPGDILRRTDASSVGSCSKAGHYLLLPSRLHDIKTPKVIHVSYRLHLGTDDN